MKRLIVALLVGAMVFGAVFGLADTLIVGGGTIQHGGDNDLQCDEDGVYIDGWAFNADEDSPGYGILDYVRVLGIDPECSSNDMFVSLWQGGTFLGKGMAHIPPDGDALDKDTSGDVGVKVTMPNVDVWKITKVDIFIEGGQPDATGP